MGRDHARLAALGALGVALALHTSPAESLIATGVVAGAGVLPDLDEPDSSVARLFGPVSRAVSSLTNRWCGGHRQASHSLVAVGVVGGAVEMLNVVRVHGVALSVGVIGICLALCLRVLLPWGFRPGHVVSFVLAGLITWWAWDHLSWIWVAAWVAAGYALHLVGDMLTSGGVPLLWPVRKRVAVPLLGHTDSGREKVLGVLMLLAVIALALHFVVALALVSHWATRPLSGV